MKTIRLTKTYREDLAYTIMLDVPKVNYSGQMTEALKKWLSSTVPIHIQKLVADPTVFNYLKVGYFSTHINSEYVNVGVVGYESGSQNYQSIPPALLAELKDLANKADAQDKARNQLRRKLDLTLAGFTTVKSLRKALPEFTKYLPPADDQPTYPVAVANTVSALVEMGWKPAPE